MLGSMVRVLAGNTTSGEGGNVLVAAGTGQVTSGEAVLINGGESDGALVPGGNVEINGGAAFHRQTQATVEPVQIRRVVTSP
jgi:hypothetical protein